MSKFKTNIQIFWQETRVTIFIVASIFICGILLGLVLPDSIKIMLIEAAMFKFASIMEGASSTFALGITIFLNNLLVASILFFSSILLIVPIFILLINGLVIGVFLDLSYNMEALIPGNFICTIVSLIPHGIFEIPAFILSSVLGINLVLKLIFGKKILSKQNRKQAVRKYVKYIFIIIIPLLCLAAIFEVTASSYIMNIIDAKYSKKYLDQTLEVLPQKDFLVEHNCYEYSKLDIQETGFFTSFIDTMPALYTTEVKDIYKGISRLPHWQSYYQCDQGNLKITSYNASEYNSLYASQAQLQILSSLGYSYEQQAKGIVEINKEDDKFYLNIKNTNNKTIIVFWDGLDKKVIENIEF